MSVLGNFGRGIGNLGTALHLPELGISELLGTMGGGNIGNSPVQQTGYSKGGKADTGTVQRTSATTPPPGPTNIQNTGGTSTAGSAADLAFLASQANDLRSLLGSLGTAEAQGLQRSEDSYNEGVGGATKDRDTQVQGQNEAKVGAYGTIDRNANRGYRSLAQIIGRASGTGSSAFQELLPDVVGKDTSAKRFDATKNYDTNLSKISTSFEDVLADLMKQKKTNEESLRTGIEGKRQALNAQLGQIEGQAEQARGGGYEAVRIAQEPYKAAIENSRNTVEGFFNQYRTPYTPKAIQATVNPYNTDRAAINAGQQGGDASNPYASLLRRKLQEQA